MKITRETVGQKVTEDMDAGFYVLLKTWSGIVKELLKIDPKLWGSPRITLQLWVSACDQSLNLLHEFGSRHVFRLFLAAGAHVDLDRFSFLVTDYE